MKKERLKKILPFLLLFLVMLIFHSFCTLSYDDIFFRAYGETIAQNGLFYFFKIRYTQWSSRLFIEIVMVGILQLPDFVWMVLNSLIYVLIAYSISYIFTDFSTKSRWLVSIIILAVFPFYSQHTAGWCATTLNYLWVFAFSIYCFVPIKNALIGKKEKFYNYIFYVLALLFGCNQEQMCVVILLTYLFFFIYFCVKNKSKKKIEKFILIQLILSILSLVFILVCPGNSVRSEYEIANHWTAYGGFNLIEKLYIGVVSTFAGIIAKTKHTNIIFSLVLLVVMFLKKKNIKAKLVACVPVLFCLSYLIIKYSGLSCLSSIKSTMEECFTQHDPSFSLKNTILLLFSGVFYLSQLVSVFMIFDQKQDKILFSFVYILGLISRFVMCMSPTVYGSGIRTFVYLEFAMLIIVVASLAPILLKIKLTRKSKDETNSINTNENNNTVSL